MPVKITITFSSPTDPEAFERHYLETHAAFASPAGQKITEDMPKFITGPLQSVVSEVQ